MDHAKPAKGILLKRALRERPFSLGFSRKKSKRRKCVVAYGEIAVEEHRRCFRALEEGAGPRMLFCSIEVLLFMSFSLKLVHMAPLHYPRRTCPSILACFLLIH